MIFQQAGTDSLLIAPVAKTNSATAGGNLDCIDGDYATIRIAFASEKNTNAVGPTIWLADGTADDTVVSNWTTVVANRTAEDLTAAKEITYHVDCKGKERYLRLEVRTATATNDDVTVAAVGTVSRKIEAPAAASDMGGVGVVVG